MKRQDGKTNQPCEGKPHTLFKGRLVLWFEQDDLKARAPDRPAV
jgi:hypothetical protein